MAESIPTEPNAETQNNAGETRPPLSANVDVADDSTDTSPQESSPQESSPQESSPQESSPQESSGRSGAAAHWCFLILSAAVILASVLMRHEGETSVFLPGTSVPLPGICTFKHLTGLECPGCGLTRSFINIGHGQWLRAARYNAAGFLVYLMVAIQIPWHAAQLFRFYRRQPRLVFPYPWTFVAVMVVALLIQWIVKLVSVLTVA